MLLGPPPTGSIDMCLEQAGDEEDGVIPSELDGTAEKELQQADDRERDTTNPTEAVTEEAEVGDQPAHEMLGRERRRRNWTLRWTTIGVGTRPKVRSKEDQATVLPLGASLLLLLLLFLQGLAPWLESGVRRWRLLRPLMMIST